MYNQPICITSISLHNFSTPSFDYCPENKIEHASTTLNAMHRHFNMFTACQGKIATACRITFLQIIAALHEIPSLYVIVFDYNLSLLMIVLCIL
jgi:hypothetical protein